ncbi:GNAT family N-acetyltransferase [Halomonas elongata]|uniref:GNAT family N-acetyltransferase n=1 Tax=Halomonas elongata (strain ATCC 33173 / DSM 2581 / NBRC 15536 / NCIMB 2198 / 1H9) TaxID=768066 RepID=E1V3W4_HALED|nr:GNAT family N-acetyltransferase [Halomonas elongata]WBF16525.1 GNAT family N-acetyltransferase [Halomonas elongata]WPU48966.1 GNAT family N-acetyltransferase [Halomonas elongata DSM 2581]CBV42793.1 GNAT family acetyltransferase [Halomonas elongata DSM 2581]
MLTTLKRWLGASSTEPAEAPAVEPVKRDPAPELVEACTDDIGLLLGAARRAEGEGLSPWVLRDETRLETLRRSLEFVVHRGLWLQREADRVAHWQGRLLALRHGDGPVLGMLLVCRRDDEAAWQLRFFFIAPEWQGRGHGARLLMAARREFRGTPLQTRLPLKGAAPASLEAAGFKRMHVDAGGVASFEAPAQWNDQRERTSGA